MCVLFEPAAENQFVSYLVLKFLVVLTHELKNLRTNEPKNQAT